MVIDDEIFQGELVWLKKPQYSSSAEASSYLDPYAVYRYELYLTICCAGFPVNACHRVLLSVSGCYAG